MSRAPQEERMPVAPLSRRRFLALSGAAAAQAALGCGAVATPTTEPAAGGGPMFDTGPLTAGNTQFATGLYSQLRQKPGSLFFSPFSISTALTMTAAGAKGDTLAEMNKLLHLPADPHPAFGTLLVKVVGSDLGRKAYTLTAANAIWGQKGYPWRPEFVGLLQKNYRAGFVEADYKADPEAARTQINGWVEKETQQKIRGLIGPGVLTPLTRIVLTNAIYFKGDWRSQFKKPLTKDQPFMKADGSKADVPLMTQEMNFPYAAADGVQVLELPYVRNELSMVVVLPAKPDGLPQVEAGLTPDALGKWKAAARSTLMRVYLPRFKAESEFLLNEPLQALGMKAAFGPKADFTGMHSSPEQVYISHVLHKAFVDVNEEGTEAAAATAVVAKNAPSPAPPEPKLFRADRPFLFLIRDNATGSVLFLGRYTGPVKS
jgi:serpin B